MDQHTVPHQGRYRVSVSAYSVRPREPVILSLRAGGNGHAESNHVPHVFLDHFQLVENEPQVYQWETGNKKIYDPAQGIGGEPIYRQLPIPQPLHSTRRLVPDDISHIIDLTHRWLNKGRDFQSAMRVGYEAILTSPAFLYHQSTLPASTERLDSYAVAERLAFFLWNGLPDSTLLELVGRDRLVDLPPVDGMDVRGISLPADSVRGGIITQASVLKVTANGTTTSPVVRGVWMLERILGVHPSPPPPGIPAIEPDIRGAVTIRDQLEKHRADATCASCHAEIDPPGGRLLDQLKSTTEEGETLLDRTMVLYGSNLGNASSHDNRNMPMILAGGGFKHGTSSDRSLHCTKGASE